MIVELQRRFLAWLVERIAQHLAKERGRPIREGRVLSPRIDGQSTLHGGRRKRTGRQSNLNPRPDTLMALTRVNPDEALGDTNREGEQLEQRQGAPGVPAKFYPLDPPLPFAMQAGSRIRDVETDLFVVHGDGLNEFGRSYWYDGDYTKPSTSPLDVWNPNRVIPYGAQILNGARSHWAVRIPWLMRAFGTSTPVGAQSRPPNLTAESFNGYPLPSWNGEYVAHASKPLEDEGIGAEHVQEWISSPIVERRDPAGELLETISVPHYIERIDFYNDPNDMPSYVSLDVYLRWWADSPGSEKGTLSIRWAVRYMSFSRDGYEAYVLEGHTPSGGPQEWRCGLTHEDGVRLMALYDATGFFDVNSPDWQGDGEARPASASWGTVTTRSEYDELNDVYDWYATRHYASGAFGRVLTNADYEAAVGCPLPGTNAGDDVIDGFWLVERAWDGRPLKAYDTFLWESNDDSQPDAEERLMRAIATAAPIMYEGALGAIPRPYATYDGTFAGIGYQADGTPDAEVFVCCDAFVQDDVTWGLVMQGPLAGGGEDVLTISRDGEIVWTGRIKDAVPFDDLGNSAQFDYENAVPWPHQRWQDPTWPHRFGAVSIGTGVSDLIYVRPRLDYERWIKAPIAVISHAV